MKENKTQKKIWVILLTVLVFLSGTMLGFATAFRVDDVTVEVSGISSASVEEAQALRTRLQEVYIDENILFVNDKNAKTAVKEFPYFRITAFKKDYPNRIVLTVKEDAEIYAVKQNEEYLILGGDGTILGIRQDSANRLDGEDNVVISGVEVQGAKGETVNGGAVFTTLLSFCDGLSNVLNGIRDNIVSIEVSNYAPHYHINTREGVKIYVGNPQNLTQEKAKAVAELYLGLSDEERLMGRIAVDDIEGEIIISYDNEDFIN